MVSQASCLVAFKSKKAIHPEQDAQGTMVVLKNKKQYTPSKMLVW